MSEVHCPVCGAELDLATVFSAHVDQQALERLIHVGFPIGAQLLRYVGLHKPTKQGLTLKKKFKLLAQLLPDLERGAIARNGRDWAAPKAHWAQAIDQMVTTAQAGRLDLPLNGHGYLYAMLQSMADKAEAAQEREAEAERRTSRVHRPAVTLSGQAVTADQALGTLDATLAALNQRDRNAAPMPPEVRARLAALRRGPSPKPETPHNTDHPKSPT